MKAFIITGASKGIGFELAHQLIQPGNEIICIARTKNEELEKLAASHDVKLTFFEQDLSETEKLKDLMAKICNTLSENITATTLINNAGVIDPIGLVENNEPDQIAKSIAINLTAPMVLTSQFIKAFETWSIEKKVMNISSGAGRRAITGWSSYCTGKAGLDHFTRVVHEEQKDKPNGVKLISIAPGIIDTGMQEKIRQADKNEFESLDRFVEYKEKGMLSTAKQTASKLINILNLPNFKELDPILRL